MALSGSGLRTPYLVSRERPGAAGLDSAYYTACAICHLSLCVIEEGVHRLQCGHGLVKLHCKGLVQGVGDGRPQVLTCNAPAPEQHTGSAMILIKDQASCLSVRGCLVPG